MEYAGFVFGIFGLMAYLQVFSLKRRVDILEEQLARTEGTQLYEERVSLKEAARSCIGKKVTIAMKEDYQDVDIVMYGNQKSGSNTILDADEQWILVRIDSAKGSKLKLIRTASVEGLSMSQE